MTGTLINIAAVVVGSLLGTFLGGRLPQKMRQTVIGGLGLVTAVVGMQMALGTHNVLLVMGSVLVGGVLGEWWHIEEGLEAAGRWLEGWVGAQRRGAEAGRDAEGGGAQRRGAEGGGAQRRGAGDRSIARAFVTASLVFCVGPMTILGSIQDGLADDYNLLAIKSMLDGFAALAFAAAMGPGVILSVLTILVIQGGLSLAAMGVGSALGQVTRQTPWVVEMTATGGLLMLGISLLLLDLKRLRIANLLPAVVIAPLVQVLLEVLGIGSP